MGLISTQFIAIGRGGNLLRPFLPLYNRFVHFMNVGWFHLRAKIFCAPVSYVSPTSIPSA
jgi:hypothetical protein